MKFEGKQEWTKRWEEQRERIQSSEGGLTNKPPPMRIRTKDGSCPNSARARPVKRSQWDRLSKALQEGVEDGTWERATDAEGTFSPIHLVEKENGDLRVTMDCTALNRELENQHITCPRWEE